jgi:hypothetical protein
LVLVVAGILKLWAYFLIKHKVELLKGGLLALIPGLIIGQDILSIIGGIIAIVESETQ